MTPRCRPTIPIRRTALLCLLLAGPLVAGAQTPAAEAQSPATEAQPPAAESKIYRCDTPTGVVFADRPCGESAEIVEIEDDSQGIDPGPPEAVREYLAEKRDERARAWEENRKAIAQTPPPPPPVVIERTIAAPFLWPAYGYPRPPVLRPQPPYRPRPEPPIEPPLRPPQPPPQRPGDTLRPKP